MSQVRPLLPRLAHFEEALHKTGWGLYYKFIVGFVSANLFTNGFIILCMHFALPLSACDTALTEYETVTIFISFSIGRAAGGFLLSSVADNTGKRCMISKSLIIIFGSCFVSAFSHNMYTLYLAAFFLGSGLQANFTCNKIYLGEILPMDKRGSYLILPDLFYTAGYATTAVLIYFFGSLNTNISEHQGMDMRLTSWRILFAIGGGLCITLACSSALLEMSPRFLIFKRRIITASLVLKQFYAINKSKYSETFDVYSQQLVDLIHDYNINIDPEPVGICSQIAVIIKVVARMIRILLKRPFVKVTSILTILKLPTLFGISGSHIYLSQLLSKPNDTVKGMHFVHLNLITEKSNCSVTFDVQEYENFLLLSGNILLAQVILLCIIDKFARKFPIFAGFVTCSLTCMVLAYSQDYTVLFIAASFFIMGITFVESTIAVLVVESFPTAVRGTAMGLICLDAYTLSSLVYIFVDVNRTIFFGVLAAIMFGISVAACLVPEMKGRPMVE